MRQTQRFRRQIDFFDPCKGMVRHLPSVLSLQAFEAAARRESFSAAADELVLSQSTVSYRVRQLEELLGLPLFTRHTRRIELTDAGVRFLPLARGMLQRLADDIETVRAEHRPRVRLHVSTYFAMRWLSPRLAERDGSSPRPELIFDHGDLAAQGPTDLTIRWGRGCWPGWRQHFLIDTDMTPYCSPTVADRLRRPEDLLRETLLCEPEGYDMWPDWMAAAGLGSLQAEQRQVLADSNVRLKAAVDGLGVVLADHLAEAEVASGALVRPFPVKVGGSGYFVMTRGTPAPPVADFISWLSASAERSVESRR